LTLVGLPLDIMTRARERVPHMFADLERERQVRERSEVLAAIDGLRIEVHEHVRSHRRTAWYSSAAVVAIMSALGVSGAKWVETRATANAVPAASLAAQDGAYKQLSEDVRHVEARLGARIVETDTIARAVADEVERRERMRPIQGRRR
jgi:hypothetical protein